MSDLGRTDQRLRVRHAVREGIESALSSDGHAVVSDLFSTYEAGHMHVEAERVPPFLRRHVEAWHGTRRATFVPLGAIGLKKLKYLPVCAELWLPNTSALVADTARFVRWAGEDLDVAPLATWRPTRLGVNYMSGSQKDPAVIPPHTDPAAESGLVMAFTVCGQGETNGQLSAQGDVHFFLGADVCRAAGLTQPEHMVSADNYRISMTAANLLSQ